MSELLHRSWDATHHLGDTSNGHAALDVGIPSEDW